jgi:hypothetical protein
MVSYGYIDLDGGNKDMLVLFPWILWSVLFFIIGLIHWKKLADNFLLFSSSFIWSSVIMLFLWLGLFGYTSFMQQSM